MKFEHKVVIDASRQKVQDFLNDFEKAARCVPGLEEVTEVEPDTYDGRVKVRIGPLGLNVGGRATLDRSSEDTWRVKGEGRDRRVGTGVNANVEARLSEVDATHTEMVMIADVQFSGRLAELGQPLIKRKADSFVHDFTENLKKAIASS